MKTILTAFLLLAALSAAAGEKTQTSGSATNTAEMTNASAKADAWTGATHKSKKQKQSTP
jgi:hypothetical protein